jgi:hypothetical protein
VDAAGIVFAVVIGVVAFLLGVIFQRHQEPEPPSEEPRLSVSKLGPVREKRNR